MEPPHWAVRTRADQLAIEQGYYWDNAKADHIIQFATRFVAPQFLNGKFTLLPWQERFLRSLYGWRRPDGGRRWRRATLSMAKKNGKTLLVSIIALYELLAADVPSPLVCSASTTISNAQQVFKELDHSIKRCERLKAICKPVPSQKIIRVKKHNAEYRALSADASNAEGLNLSCVIVDEAHAHRSEKLYRALEYATVARPDGLLVVISTAGSDQAHFFYDLYTKAKNILDGTDLDLTTYAEIYECPEGQEETEEGWSAANPSLGTSFSVEDFRRDMQAAKLNRGDYLSFRKYRLSQWVQAEDSWLDVSKWDQCESRVPESDLKKAPCFLGVDLSATTDPTSVSACWHLGAKKFHVRNWSWVCEGGVKKREASNLPLYKQFSDMTVTRGDVIDEARVKAKILDLCATYLVKEIVFDSYNAITMATELGQSKTVFKFPQNYRYYNAPCKSFEVAISEKRLSHDGSALMRWAVQNVRLSTDEYGNVKPNRDKSTDKIDPIVSTLMAYARAIETSVELTVKKSVYDSRGILSF